MTKRDHDRTAALFHAGAAQASRALAAWLDRPASVVVDRLAVLPLEEAVTLLGDDGEPICGCAMQVSGGASGVLVLAASDPAGLMLADVLLGRQVGTSAAWGDLERSAMIETANIVGCGYLNAIAAGIPGGADAGVLPTPPWFVRDFPAAVMEAVLVANAAASDTVLLAATEFRIDGVPIRCGLVFVPDAAGLGLLGTATGVE
jgi:chemotaxis protein CheC